MTSILSSHPYHLLIREARYSKALCLGYLSQYFPSKESTPFEGQYLFVSGYSQRARKCGPLYFSKLDDSMEPDVSEDQANEGEPAEATNDKLRENLERIVGAYNVLATLTRNKYGMSYNVQLIKKIF